MYSALMIFNIDQLSVAPSELYLKCQTAQKKPAHLITMLVSFAPCPVGLNRGLSTR
jgi:hypothetical protein